MTSPRFTIGLPFRNPGPGLELAVQSVFAQTESDWELLLVDDGSSDGSVERVRQIRDTRVRVVADGHRRGLPARLNQIAQMARAPMLVRMDADDAMRPHRLRAIGEMELQPDRLAASHAVLIDEASVPYGSLHSTARHAFRNDYVVHPTVAGWTEWFRRNPYSDRYIRAEDRELWCRTFQPEAVQLLDEPLLFYRRSRRLELNKHRRTLPSLLRLALRYGPPLVGPRSTATEVAKIVAKQGTYELLHLLGIDEAVLRARRPQLPATSADMYREELRLIAAAPVAGWTGEGFDVGSASGLVGGP